MGCDEVSPLNEENGQPPRVSNLTVAPDTVTAPASTDTVEVTLNVSAQVQDPEGIETVDRAVVIVEPASDPFRTGEITVQPEVLQLGASFSLSLPVQREVYSVRLSAVDADGLPSNRAITQFQLIPDS